MEKKNQNRGAETQGKRLGFPVKVIAAVLAILLLTLVAFRLHAWMEQRRETRVIVLVNPWNEVDNTDFVPDLGEIEEVRLDKSCVQPLRQMLADCRQAGLSPTVLTGYRSREEQLTLFNNEMDRQMRSGLDANAAYSRAEKKVGAPGSSEHELGLAVDIGGEAAQAWLRENAWRYGFILRYPAGSESITGRDADNTHFRYVGLAAAEQIQVLNITLEEYMEMFYTQQAEIIFE